MSTDSLARNWEQRVAAQTWNRRGASFDAAGLKPAEGSNSGKNVGTAERFASLTGGAALMLAGRQKGDWGGLLLALAGAGLLYRGATGRCQCYQALGISTAEHDRNTIVPAKQGAKVEKSITVNKPAAELYEFWRDLSNLPRTFKHLKSVETQDGNCSHWVARGPANINLEWDAEVLNDHENKLIAWRSLPGSQVDTAGSIRFVDRGERGTEVTVALKYNPPGGQLAHQVAAWGGADLETMITEEFRRFKSLMEAGEVPSTEGQPSGRKSR
jgi:uncharacterized membrane protein